MAETPDGIPVDGDEARTLLTVLERNRRTFRWKCADLDDEQMRISVAASTMTLAGLVKHLALVEEFSFTERVAGRTMLAPFDEVDFDADPDWEWRTANEESAPVLLALFDTCVARSRAVVAELVGDRPTLDIATAFTMKDGTVVELRRIVADLIEEYARHTGHADIIREAIDGRVGENAPEP